MSPLIHPPRDLTGFPVYELLADRPLFRIHQARYGPWWVSSEGHMRFDLAPPSGTCYLADEATGAFVEAFQDWTGSIIPIAEVLSRRISTLAVPHAMRLADCANPRALSFGVTAEIHSSPIRTVTQEWAAAFATSGLDGVRFLVRHDPGQQCVGIALFGLAGEANWLANATKSISADLMAEVEARFGIRVR